MRIFSLGLLLSSACCRPAAAQVLPAPKGTVATRYQLPGADCALFPATARLPDWLPEKKLTAHRRFTPAASQVAAAEKALATVQLLRVNSGAKTNQDSTYARNITQRLGQYHRQYFGFYNMQRQPCLFINLLLNTDFDGIDIGMQPRPPGYIPHWLRAPQQLADGGWQYWSVYYNLTTYQFSNYWHDLDLAGG